MSRRESRVEANRERTQGANTRFAPTESEVFMRIALGDYSRLLRRYLAPQGGVVAGMAVLLLASIGLQLAGPQVVRAFIDAARAGAAESALAAAALAFIG